MLLIWNTKLHEKVDLGENNLSALRCLLYFSIVNINSIPLQHSHGLAGIAYGIPRAG
jgi:hypothetical protein